MRLNPKIFELANGVEPVEKQEFDNRLVEVYYMNDFEIVFDQNAPKGKFAVWTSIDGFNYRLFVEKGYYEKVGELYTDAINKIWLDFWDQCDDTTKKYNFRIMLPLAGMCLILFLITGMIPVLEKASIYIQIGVFAIFIIGMFFLNKKTKTKLAELNAESVQLIKEHLTEKRFNQLMEEQKQYTDDFFAEQARLAEEKYGSEEDNKQEPIAEESISSIDENIEILEEIEENKKFEEERQEVLNNIESEVKEEKSEIEEK